MFEPSARDLKASSWTVDWCMARICIFHGFSLFLFYFYFCRFSLIFLIFLFLPFFPDFPYFFGRFRSIFVSRPCLALSRPVSPCLALVSPLSRPVSPCLALPRFSFLHGFSFFSEFSLMFHSFSLIFRIFCFFPLLFPVFFHFMIFPVSDEISSYFFLFLPTLLADFFTLSCLALVSPCLALFTPWEALQS